MNDNLNLVEILKDAPEGTKLWSPVYGDVRFLYVDPDFKLSDHPDRPIVCEEDYFTKDGKIYANYHNTECILFPSKENRDWSTFKIPKSLKKEKNHIPKPFDKVFGWYDFNPFHILYPDIFLCKDKNYDTHKTVYRCEFGTYDHIKPYNEEEYLEHNSND